jgi:Ca2+-binding RTX toxin-like protein
LRAGLLLAAGVGLSAALSPAAAVGATAFVEFDDGIGGRILWYEADPGETNQVEVRHVDPDTTIRDSGAMITAGPGCVSISVNEVSCPEINYFVSVDLGDGDDEAVVVEDSAASAFGVNVGGGDGSDELSACDACRSTLGGGDGNDILTGGLVGGGSVFGNGGNDTLTGNPGDGGTLSGGAGDDTITGGDRWNPIQGGGGNDTIVAGPGFDLIEPGGGVDNVDGGPGSDTVSYRRFSAPVVVDLRTGEATAGGDVDALVSITNAIGTRRHSDRLIGDSENNRLNGAGGDRDELLGGAGDDVLRGGERFPSRPPAGDDDRLFGGAGNDWLRAGSGGDVLVGGPGRDTIQGQEGDDWIRAADGMKDIVHGGPDADRAMVDGQLDIVSGVERLLQAVLRR